MAISATHCASHGHTITSVRINDKMVRLHTDETLLVPQYLTLCMACGLSLEEIKELEKQPPKRIRKPKAKPVLQETA
jgi:hypothetical protein